jgi:hypothetical protein
LKQLPLAVFILAIAAIVGTPATMRTVAVAATPTPTPVALQYDELQKMVMSPATAPPPGAFQDDYKLAMQAPNTSGVDEGGTPPPHRGGLGGLGAMMGGAMGGHRGPPGMGDASGMMNMMKYGNLTRYTYYWVKQWVRVDYPVSQTATITKCKEHQIIQLDLAKKTYTIVNTGTSGCDTGGQAPSGMSMPGAPVSSEPGTVDVTINSTDKNLGPLTIDGINTNGNDSTLSVQMSNATGSCKNSPASEMQTVKYVSNIDKPRPYCPLSVHAGGIPTTPQQAMSRGGCKPSIHGNTGGGNPMAMMSESQKLEMYSLLTMQSQRGSFGSLTERGNVAWLYKPQAEALFAIPPDFTEAPH